MASRIYRAGPPRPVTAEEAAAAAAAAKARLEQLVVEAAERRAARGKPPRPPKRWVGVKGGRGGVTGRGRNSCCKAITMVVTQL